MAGQGGGVGPDLAGAGRNGIPYFLENIIDPSAVMAKEYIPNVITLNSGRIITGLIKEQTKAALTVVTATETVIFDALGKAGGDDFKALSKLLK